MNKKYLILSDMFRTHDKKIIKNIQSIEKKYHIKFNSVERKKIRLHAYYGDMTNAHLKDLKLYANLIFDIETLKFNEEKYNLLEINLRKNIEKFGESKIKKSILEREKLFEEVINNADEWLSLTDDFYKSSGNEDLSILRINSNIIKKYGIDSIFESIKIIYENLRNYRTFFIVFDDSHNETENYTTWSEIAKIGIFSENVVVSTFDEIKWINKRNHMNAISEIIMNRSIDIDNNVISKYTDKIGHGFVFKDLFISKDSSVKILKFKKIKLDKRKLPCPDCLEYQVSSNSFPTFLLQSFECKNENCISRSKSGRGKRFDFLSVYNNFMMMKNTKDKIEDKIYNEFRRDIFVDKNSIFEMLITFNSFSNEKVLIYEFEKGSIIEKYGRNIKIDTLYEKRNISLWDNIPFIQFLNNVKKADDLIKKPLSKNIYESFEIINGDSTIEMLKYSDEIIDTAMTSPPYFNAREYSNWYNFECYLLDMYFNARSVNNILKPEGYYLYNVGDIVGQSNMRAESTMSKKRMMLGFYSLIILELADFYCRGNIIWDKGEVQSKRNSTLNRFPNYINPINAYEHVLIMQKKNNNKIIQNLNIDYIIKIKPVFKINCKGDNTLGHTAPYPEDLVGLLSNFHNSGYILDPFLGSGSTLMWAKKNGFNGLGFELNRQYWRLSKERIDNYE